MQTSGRGDEASDEDLVRRISEDPGHPIARVAATELFGRYRERVYLWCFRFVQDHEMALDLAQDALLSAYRSLGSFQGESRFSSWLYAIARNRCFNELRRPAIFSEEHEDLEAVASGGEDPIERLIRRIDEERLLALIHRHLDEQEQNVLWLRCIERMPIDAITAVLAIRQSSGARGVLQRARRKLRAALQRDLERQEIEP